MRLGYNFKHQLIKTFSTTANQSRFKKILATKKSSLKYTRKNFVSIDFSVGSQLIQISDEEFDLGSE
jgi:hypothetical protein